MENPKQSTPDRLFAALGNPLRWQIVLRLADGRALAATSLAQEFGRDFDGVSKHLRLLRSAGVLSSRRGEDRRVELYFIPETFLKTPGQLDFGYCTVALGSMPQPAPMPVAERKPRARPAPRPAAATSPATPSPAREQKKVEPLPKKPEPIEAENEDEEEDAPQGFGEMLARTGALPFALGGNPGNRRDGGFRR